MMQSNAMRRLMRKLKAREPRKGSIAFAAVTILFFVIMVAFLADFVVRTNAAIDAGKPLKTANTVRSSISDVAASSGEFETKVLLSIPDSGGVMIYDCSSLTFATSVTFTGSDNSKKTIEGGAFDDIRSRCPTNSNKNVIFLQGSFKDDKFEYVVVDIFPVEAETDSKIALGSGVKAILLSKSGNVGEPKRISIVETEASGNGEES